MWEARRRRHQARQLEEQLRSARPVPRDELVARIESNIGTRRAPTAWSRLAFAGALSTLILGTFASFGGFGYAASGTTQALGTVKMLAATHKVHVLSAADDQYKPTPQTPSHEVRGASQAQSAGVAAAAESRSLPFTGFSLLGTVIVALALITLGMVLRRRERSRS
jgi:hypothetical protein